MEKLKLGTKADELDRRGYTMILQVKRQNRYRKLEEMDDGVVGVKWDGDEATIK